MKTAINPQTDFQTPEKGNPEMKNRVARDQELGLPLNESYGKNRGLQYLQLVEVRSALAQLHQITGVQQVELRGYSGDLPTSFVNAETEIAKCISECLADVPSQKRSISYVQSLLRDYEVLRLVPGQNPSVSLERVHTILQDNFPDSSLCYLLNILLSGWNDLTTKVITFY